MTRVALLVVLLGVPAVAEAQIPQTGAEMYRTWCAVCHAEDGSGQGATRPVKTTPIDFRDCRQTTAEPDADWRLVIGRGGSAAGLATEMPAFEALNAQQIDLLVAHLRTFCRDPRWPDPRLNLRRAIFTAKAFPEDEVALRPMVSHGSAVYTTGRIDASYETRLGPRTAVEVEVPLHGINGGTGVVTGVGDIEIDGRYVLVADPVRPLIAAAGLAVSFPTGSRRWGFGEGTGIVEPYVATGTEWRRFQIQGDVRALYFTHKLPEFYPAFAYSVAVMRDLGVSARAWTIGVDIDGTDSALGITPQIQKALTRTGALIGAFGVRLPVRPPYPQLVDQVRFVGFLRWDYKQPIRARR